VASRDGIKDHTLVSVDLQIELGEEELPQVEQTNIHVSTLDDLLNQLRAQWLLGLVVAAHFLEHLRFPTPILQHLRRRLDEVTRDTCAVEPRVLGFAEEAMEDMSHLMEESNNVIVAHEGGLLWSGFGKVGNHGSQRVAARPITLGVAAQEGPDGSMRVFRL